MKIKLFIIVLLLFTLLYGNNDDLFAGGRRLGTAGAVELLIPMGARSVGMAGANIATVQGVEAIYWNPAGVSLIDNTQASFSYMTYFADMNISYFAVASKISSLGSIGFSLQAMDIGDIPVTTIENPEGTGENLVPQFITVNTSYSRSFTDRINFGINAKLISEKIGNMGATAFAFDLGLQYVTPFGVNFGIIMKNIGTNLKYSGTGIEFDSSIPLSNPNATTRKTVLDMASHELPTSMTMGIGYRYQLNESNSLDFQGVYGTSNFGLDAIDIGAEYAFNNLLFGRIGFNNSIYPDDFPDAAQESQYGLALGFGINLPLGKDNLMFDYAYRSMDTFDANQYFTLTASF